VVEVDQTEMPLRTDDGPYSPLKTGKIIVIGAVEVISLRVGAAFYGVGRNAALRLISWPIPIYARARAIRMV
jgi:hypothetical protein